MVDKKFDGINHKRVSQLKDWVPELLRKDYLDTSLDPIKRATDHITVDGIDWYNSSKHTLTKILESLDLKKQDTLIFPWRAGIWFFDALIDMDTVLDKENFVHFWLARDEDNPNQTKLTYLPYLESVLDRMKNEEWFVYILDIMLATAWSIETIIESLDGVVEKNRFQVACLLAAPEWIKNLQSKYPNIYITTWNVDEKLDKRGFIVPGFWDAGYKLFNIYKNHPDLIQKITASLWEREKGVFYNRLSLCL